MEVRIMKGFVFSLFSAVVAAAVVTLVPCILYAAGAAAEAEPLVDFGSVFDTLKGTVTTIVIAAIGLGLGIWATRFIFGIVKSMGRG
jgi:hypothetical protein